LSSYVNSFGYLPNLSFRTKILCAYVAIAIQINGLIIELKLLNAAV